MENPEKIPEKIDEIQVKYRSGAQELILICFRFFCVFLFLFLMAGAVVFGKSLFVTNVYEVAKTVAKKVNKVVDIIPIKDRYAFLLLGTDMLIDVNRTDTMIVAFLSVPERRVDIVSIPRDTKIEIPGHGVQKINAVYTFEYVKTKSDAQSIKKVVSRIEDLSKTKIDYYVKVDLKGFEKIINLFGGVEIDVEKNMTYDDNKQDLHIRLKKGLQTLDGKKGLEYCRFRHDKLGDLGRMQRQQKFIKALLNKFKESKTYIRLPDIISGSMRFVSTNIDLPLLLALVAAIPEPSKMEVHSHSFAGDYGYVDNLCYFIPETEKYQKLVENITSGEIIKVEAEKADAERKKEAERNEKAEKKSKNGSLPTAKNETPETKKNQTDVKKPDADKPDKAKGDKDKEEKARNEKKDGADKADKPKEPKKNDQQPGADKAAKSEKKDDVAPKNGEKNKMGAKDKPKDKDKQDKNKSKDKNAAASSRETVVINVSGDEKKPEAKTADSDEIKIEKIDEKIHSGDEPAAIEEEPAATQKMP